MSSKILLVTALYIEAKPFIHTLQLKPLKTKGTFQVFANEKYELIITGTGKMASSAGTSFLINNCDQEISVCLNFGICGGKNEEKGSVFLIDQICDESSQRNLYPDIFQKTDIFRSTLHTLDRPDTAQSFSDLVDMEGSGFFVGASYFLDAHKIQLLKMVSDFSDTKQLNKKEVEEMIFHCVPRILAFCESFDSQNLHEDSQRQTDRIFHSLLTQYHFTQTQSIQCKKLLHQLSVQGDDVSGTIAHIQTTQNLSSAKIILHALTEKLRSYS